MLRRLIFILLTSLFLAACDSAEERAQKHFEKGLVLLEEGDVERALIEFRNVFKLNGTHKDARITYARVEEERGNAQAAYSQYLRLVEQYPDNLEGRRALSRMAAADNNWEEVTRHLTVAEQQAPQDLIIQSVRASLDYRTAIQDTNSELADLAVMNATALLEQDPSLIAARRVLVYDLLRRQDWQDALEVITSGIEINPDNRALYILRLNVLEQMKRSGEVIAQLKEMVERFPDAGLHSMLVSYYVTENRLAEAEAYLKERARNGDSDTQVELISFLALRVDRETAIMEIDRILAGSDENVALLRSLRAGLEFEAGKKDAAILELKDILKTATPSEETDRIKVSLAQMLINTGNIAEARELVDEVLEHDPTQTSAIKLQAAWMIKDDKPGDALVELRHALDLTPQDSELMTLMALAHERSGNRDLMGESLAGAVDFSGNALEESLLYTQFLVQEDKLLLAEEVLKDALRFHNTNPQLLSMLGSLYVRMEDWPRTQHVIDTLERFDTEQARALANELTARKLAGQSRADELEQFLSGLANGDDGLQAVVSVIGLRLARGDAEGALEYAEEILKQNPENPRVRFLRAGVLAAQGQHAQATAILRTLISEDPKNEQAWLTLYRLELSQVAPGTAMETLESARVALPDSLALKWAAAEAAEKRGDIETAITLYEDMYQTNNDSVVIANNLASLIASYRDDDASLKRAFEIGRRLRDEQIPAFKDTYGWIAHRLGNYGEALEYLEAASEGLPKDPIVQFHLAENYSALGQNEMALKQYGKAIALMQGNLPLKPFEDRAKAEVERLSALQN